MGDNCSSNGEYALVLEALESLKKKVEALEKHNETLNEIIASLIETREASKILSSSPAVNSANLHPSESLAMTPVSPPKHDLDALPQGLPSAKCTVQTGNNATPVFLGREVLVQPVSENPTRPCDMEHFFNDTQDVLVTVTKSNTEKLGVFIAGGQNAQSESQDGKSIFLPLKILQVQTGSPGARAGLITGDILVSVNDIALLQATHAFAVAKFAESCPNMTLKVRRGVSVAPLSRRVLSVKPVSPPTPACNTVVPENSEA